MVVKVYISGISGNKEVKKRQQRVLLILDSKNIKYELLDIAEPNMEEAKEYMQNNSTMNGATISDPTPRHPLPPQLYNEEEYCGDYDAFDMANETDEMEKFLKLPVDEIPTLDAEIKLGNGEVPSEGKSKEASPDKESEVQENGKEEEVPKEDEAKEENVSKEEDVPKEEESEEKPKEKSPSPEKEKSPSPQKEKSPSPQKEKSPSPQKEKSPSPPKEKSPSPQKEKSPSPAKEEDGGGDNETDDQKAESVENASKGEDVETANDTEETEKSEEA